MIKFALATHQTAQKARTTSADKFNEMRRRFFLGIELDFVLVAIRTTARNGSLWALALPGTSDIDVEPSTGNPEAMTSDNDHLY